MFTGAAISAINAIGYNVIDNMGYGRFSIATPSGNSQLICRFGTGSPVPPDPNGLSPLSPVCLCTAANSGNSGVVAHDTLFFSSGGKNLLALTGLSSRPAGSAACGESDFDGFMPR